MPEEVQIVLRNYNLIDPLRIDDYINRGGYQSLNKARSMDRKSVIAEISQSKLRGRGGAGFNCGSKWSFAADSREQEKFVICNADEGEPGTYKDRIILQSDPHSVIEGMMICAHAIDARCGFIYLRCEYTYLNNLLQTAIEQARQKGFLENFNIEIRRGAGAYVCGEETALIESLEGKRGEPRYKPPFPPLQGLWAKPTIVNNVETLANIPAILENGSKWFSSIGAAGYPGTKLFSLTGDIKNASFFEVPTDTTIRDIIYKYGGGIPGGKAFKAAQVGGSSGAFVPENLLDTSLDLDSMQAAGLTLGSGAVLVLDETRDILEAVLRTAAFFEHESCGKCTPCREGTPRLRRLIQKIQEGSGSQSDLDLSKLLGRVMSCSSLCGLGQSAPVPLLSTINHFPAEYTDKISTSQEGSPW